MKQKDIGLLVVIAIVSAVLSIFLSGLLFSSEEDRSQRVEVVGPISAEFTEPPKAYFNDNAVNPTQTIKIQEGDNDSPFGQEE